MPTASVTLTIDSFVPTASGHCVIRRPVVTNHGGNRVALKSTDPADHALVVKQKGAADLDIQFVIAPAGLYRADEILFAGEAGTSAADGSENFPPGRRRKSQNTVTVANVFRHTGGSGGTLVPRWEYSIAVTEIATNRTGLIDPGIENSDQN